MKEINRLTNITSAVIAIALIAFFLVARQELAAIMKIVADLNIFVPEISRWLDIPAIPAWLILYVVIINRLTDKDNRFLGIGLVWGLLFGLTLGTSFCLFFSPSVGLTLGLAAGLIFSLVYGLAIGPAFNLGFSSGFSLTAGLAFGLIYSLVLGLIVSLVFILIFGLVALLELLISRKYRNKVSCWLTAGFGSN